jgi:geranyl-CoA carboxylase alpha subunit
MGLQTVSVFSEADQDTLMTTQAQESFYLGPGDSRDTYLNIDRIMEAARKTGAQAIHPGYGFLSEQADFARACEENGLIFIGPRPEAIEMMASKRRSRHLLESRKVPVLPAYAGEKQDLATLVREAQELGFPLLAKASLGGGGRGMERFEESKNLRERLQRLQSHSARLFGSKDLILERCLQGARHIEVQILADSHGNFMHLGCRECSIQRRNQKIIEECPPSNLTRQVQEEICETALRVAEACEYRGAGTVEFLLDPQGNFYFLEMNTRLQVEHPITEMVTDIDIVEWQIRIAMEEVLHFSKTDKEASGHSIEVRLYAEDPDRNFLAQSGLLESIQFDKMEGIRIDHGLMDGDWISEYYDPLLAKIISWGSSREVAISRLARALDRTLVLGVHTNLKLLRSLLASEDIKRGIYDTGTLERFIPGFLSPPEKLTDECKEGLALGILAHYFCVVNEENHHQELLHWRNSGTPSYTLKFMKDNEKAQLSLSLERTIEGLQARVRGGFGDCSTEFEWNCALKDYSRGSFTYCFDSHWQVCSIQRLGRSLGFMVGGKYQLIEMVSDTEQKEEQTVENVIRAPVGGTLLEVLAKVGDQVQREDLLARIESMKMEHLIKSPRDGIIEKSTHSEGQFIKAEAILFEFEEKKILT